ncbi:hypothetical protein AB0N38_33110 [Micromonospora aurantiaca]|uniref:hypothetical protein n=1 Tax=Micromonospora aurantiaca (nom. illeg.) TaxID=47850 RepID=UPI003436E050
MPLYLHRDGEIKRTVPGKHEDARVKASKDWRPITPADVLALREIDDDAARAAAIAEAFQG